jgi:hypothetical protein
VSQVKLTPLHVLRKKAKLRLFVSISKPVSRFLVPSLALFLLVSVSEADEPSQDLPTPDRPLKVKVVILTTFEIGADTGDTPVSSNFGWNVEK